MSDTYSTDGPQCPYCGRQYTADESHYYDEMNYTEEVCDECDKKFSVSVCSTVAWSCEAIDDVEDKGAK
jgi:ribosomal protein L37AE/L43A